MVSGPDPPSVTLSIWARPGSKREEVRWDPWRKGWQVSVRAPPVEGEANRAILELLARRLGLGTSELSLVSGERSKEKRVIVRGLSEARVRELLEGSGAGAGTQRLLR